MFKHGKMFKVMANFGFLLLFIMWTCDVLAGDINSSPWGAPTEGWDYIYDPDMDSPVNLTEDGWVHDNSSDEYPPEDQDFALEIDGQLFEPIKFIDDDEGGLALRIYDPGDPRDDPYLLTDPGSRRKFQLSRQIGEPGEEQATLAFRMRSVPFTDNFGVEIPFGYFNSADKNLIAVNLNIPSDHYWEAIAAGQELTSCGIPLIQDQPNALYFPQNGGYYEGRGDPVVVHIDENWDHTVWHEYWITYDLSGEGEHALYVDGELSSKFPPSINFDLHATRNTDNQLPEGALRVEIFMGDTTGSGTVQFDWLAYKLGIHEPQEATDVVEWALY